MHLKHPLVHIDKPAFIVMDRDCRRGIVHHTPQNQIFLLCLPTAGDIDDHSNKDRRSNNMGEMNMHFNRVLGSVFALMYRSETHQFLLPGEEGSNERPEGRVCAFRFQVNRCERAQFIH